MGGVVGLALITALVLFLRKGGRDQDDLDHIKGDQGYPSEDGPVIGILTQPPTTTIAKTPSKCCQSGSVPSWAAAAGVASHLQCMIAGTTVSAVFTQLLCAEDACAARAPSKEAGAHQDWLQH